MANDLVPTRPSRRLNGLQYAALLKEQGGGCAICGQPETMRNDQGEILPLVYYYLQRGPLTIRRLLCHVHNFGLSCFQDSPHLLLRAMAVIEGFDAFVSREARVHHDDEEE